MSRPRDLPARHQVAAFLVFRTLQWVFGAFHNLGLALVVLAAVGALSADHRHHQADRLQD